MEKTAGIKSIFHYFGERTSMHGAGQLSSAKSIKAKVFWSLACLGSIGMLFYMLTSIIIEFFNFNVMVNIKEVKNRDAQIWATQTLTGCKTTCNAQKFKISL